MPTHFFSGVSNVQVGNMLYDYGRLDPSTYVDYWEDFLTYAAGDWTITKVGTGTQALAAAPGAIGGWLTTTNTAAGTDSVFNQLVGSAYRFTAGKRMLFRTRLKTSDANLSAVIAGVYAQDTTPLDVTDGIFFLKSSASTTVNLIIRKASTSTTIACGVMANDTMTELGWLYDPGSNTIQAFRDGSPVASTSVLTNVPNTSDMAVGFGIQNGEAVAKILTVDYVHAALER